MPNPQPPPHPSERRSLYRILHVQPEAPHAVIKAAYRALMTTLRAHPDLGGDHDQAARLNAAWAVLGDPERRREYDRALRKPPRSVGSAASSAGASAKPAGQASRADTAQPRRATAAPRDPWSWAADRICPFCSLAFQGKPTLQQRCARCNAALWPAPSAPRDADAGRAAGRRQAARFERHQAATMHLPGQPLAQEVRLRDLSLAGVSLYHVEALPPASVFRLVTPDFDCVAVVIACRRQGAVSCLHARLLTLQLAPRTRGVYVDTRA
jgi:hypothetical protein